MAKEYKVDYYSIIGFSVLTIFIWRFHYGYYILYPFTIMGTWFHEMGHGIMSMMVGGDFIKLEFFPNGSGLAWSKYPRCFFNPKSLFNCIGFGLGDFFGKINNNAYFDIVFVIEENTWNRNTKLQLNLRDIKINS